MSAMMILVKILGALLQLSGMVRVAPVLRIAFRCLLSCAIAFMGPGSQWAGEMCAWLMPTCA